jgi:hypothetical protein
LGLDSGERAVERGLPADVRPTPRPHRSEDAIDWLTTGLATTELLIVLDNCEHVLAEAATGGVDHRSVVPGVSVLATSREPLGVSGERVMALQPLDLDDAMSLFASRAADSDGDFVLNGASEAAVATICTNVDRLPLAIELTAARTRASRHSNSPNCSTIDSVSSARKEAVHSANSRCMPQSIGASSCCSTTNVGS